MVLFNFNRYLAPLLTAVTIWLSIVIANNSSIYFTNGPTPSFMIEKGSLVEYPIWMVSFYFHVFSACTCLLVGAPLMIPAMLKFRKTHMVLGYIYFNCVLWIAGPTGLIMSPVAKGGVLGAIGFLLTGIAWWSSTWLGLRAIQRRDIQSHIRWMVRSYSLALSAVFFRLFQMALFRLNVADEVNYIASIYLSLGASVLLAEICVASKFYFKTSRNVRANAILIHARESTNQLSKQGVLS